MKSFDLGLKQAFDFISTHRKNEKESMIKYFAVAVAFKIFSLSNLTKKTYRFLGNRHQSC